MDLDNNMMNRHITDHQENPQQFEEKGGHDTSFNAQINTSSGGMNQEGY
jgi:hypothetical protein